MRLIRSQNDAKCNGGKHSEKEKSTERPSEKSSPEIGKGIRHEEAIRNCEERPLKCEFRKKR